MKKINLILFNGFETLDAFGPVEIFGRLTEEYKIYYFSLAGGVVTSSQGVSVNTRSFEEMTSADILLIPGGKGTRSLVDDSLFISSLEYAAQQVRYILSVCTGAALLAKTSLLNGKCATSNKRAFEWVRSINQEVKWVDEARWVVDGMIYTSSGVSAGMDMTLGFIADQFGKPMAKQIAFDIEYLWNEDRTKDFFAKNSLN